MLELVPGLRTPTSLEIRYVRFERLRLPLSVGMITLTGAFGALGIINIYRGTPNWWTADPFAFAALIGLPIEMAAAIAALYWLHGRTRDSVSLTPEGIVVTARRAGSSLIRWDYPRLSLGVIIRKFRTERPAPVITWGYPIAPGTPVSLGSAYLLVSAAHEHGLKVKEFEVGVGKWRSRVISIRASKSASRADSTAPLRGARSP
jgi:hypothetical protein